MLLSRTLEEHLISPLTGLSVMFQKDQQCCAFWKTGANPHFWPLCWLPRRSHFNYGFSCCLKSYGENTKGCCHLRPVSCSHIKLPLKAGEGFCCLLSHFLLCPSQKCSRSFFCMGFLNGFLVFCHGFSCDVYLSAGSFLLLLSQEHWGSELHSEQYLIKLLRRQHKTELISKSRVLETFQGCSLCATSLAASKPPAEVRQVLCSHHFGSVQIWGMKTRREPNNILCL